MSGRPPSDDEMGPAFGEIPSPDELAALIAELDAADPLPESLVAMAVDLYAWHNAEAELLELLVDSAAEPLPLARAESSVRVIAFGDATRGVHFECHHAGDRVTLTGAVQPAGPHKVVAERIGHQDQAATDAFGLFELGPIGTGRVRIIVRSPDGADLLVTPWFVLEAP